MTFISQHTEKGKEADAGLGKAEQTTSGDLRSFDQMESSQQNRENNIWGENAEIARTYAQHFRTFFLGEISKNLDWL